MSAPLESLLVGVVLGFSLAVPPGPMNAWIAAVAARSYRGGVITGLGAMTADGLLGAAVFLLARGLDLHAAVRFVYLLGAGVMAYLGVRLLRVSPSEAGAAPDERAFLRALGIGLSNPYQVVWWLTAGVAFAYLGGLVLLAGLFGAILAWVLAFPWAVHAGARRRPGVQRAIGLVSAAILIGFAAYFAALFVTG
jgi:threonine/homoserine/homoserine lactone efflux protein